MSALFCPPQSLCIYYNITCAATLFMYLDISSNNNFTFATYQRSPERSCPLYFSPNDPYLIKNLTLESYRSIQDVIKYNTNGNYSLCSGVYVTGSLIMYSDVISNVKIQCQTDKSKQNNNLIIEIILVPSLLVLLFGIMIACVCYSINSRGITNIKSNPESQPLNSG